MSSKNKEVLLGPLSKNNPVIVQMLGICYSQCRTNTQPCYRSDVGYLFCTGCNI